jgi:hypothetical protein
VASVIQSFRNDEELLSEQAGPTQRSGAKAGRDDFARGSQATSTLVCRENKAARRKQRARINQERVERYHKIHELYANKVDVATIAHHVGLSRQGVYNYLKMKQPPERTRINQPRKPLIEPYKEHLVKRWNKGSQCSTSLS